MTKQDILPKMRLYHQLLQKELEVINPIDLGVWCKDDSGVVFFADYENLKLRKEREPEYGC